MAYTAPTTRSTGELITASIWNTDLVNNISYLKASPTFDGLITVSGAGTSTFSAATATVQRIDLINTTSGSTATASYKASAGTSSVFLFAYSQGYTTSTYEVANGGALLCTTAGGLSIVATAGSSTVRIYAANTLAGTWAAAGLTIPGTLDVTGTLTPAGLTVIPDGSAAAPKLVFAGATTTGFARNSEGATDLDVVLAGVTAAYFNKGGGLPQLTLKGGSNSTGSGTVFFAQRNSSGTPAAGAYGMHDLNAVSYWLWTDAAGVVRIGTTSPPSNSTDTGGTVIGTQTSTRASKDITGPFTANAQALRTILQTPLWRFRYKSRAYHNQRFVGITTDDSPEFGMDQGRSFNPVNAFGFTVAAIKALARKLDKATADIATLRARMA